MKYMVLVNEKTKIDVSLGAFNSGSILTNSLMDAKRGQQNKTS